MSTGTSRVLTLVFTDLADSTALKARHGDLSVGDLIARHREHVTRIAEESSGRVIDWAGDGCFLTFETSSAGVMFALRLQQAHAEDPELPGVRVGIHMGEVTEKPGPGEAPRIEGLAVDIAARIQGLARPGQVLMSSAVYYSARQRLGVEAFGRPLLWQAYGVYSVKGFDDPLDICEAGLEGLSPLQAPEAGEKAYPLVVQSSGAEVETSGRNRAPVAMALPLVIGVVAIAGLAYYVPFRNSEPQALPSGPDASITSLAVLPLDNLMNDDTQDYFVDGMTEALIAELAKIKSLKVISRTSVMRLKDTDKSIPEIARELGVDAVIEGSVLKANNEVRITAQLIHGRTDEHLWAESYINTLENVLQLQSEVAFAVAESIEASITAEESAELRSAGVVNPQAYEQYLLGHYQAAKRTNEGLERSVEHFQRAIEIDPDYAQAYAGLADSYNLLASWGFRAVEPAFLLAEQAAQDALALNPNLAEAHTSLAWVNFYYRYNWAAAEKGFRRAIALNPNYATAHHWYAEFLDTQRRFDEAEAAFDRALELDPLSLITNASKIWHYSFLKHFDKVQEQAERTLALDPDFGPALLWYAQAAVAAEKFDIARDILARHGELLRTFRGAELLDAELAAASGNISEAQTILQAHLARTAGGEQNEWAMARVFVYLGELDRALDYIEIDLEQRDHAAIPWLAAEAVWAPLYGHPRFEAILKQLNLADVPNP